jgi:hypothetical protein
LKHSYLSNIKDPEELPKEVIQRITSLQHFSLNGWLKARNHSCCLDRSNCPIYSTNFQFYSSNTLKDIHLCFLILTVSQIYWTPRANEYHYCFVFWVSGVQLLARRQANVTGILCGNKMPTRCNRWIFIADLIACSTCFGHLYAHHQEL